MKKFLAALSLSFLVFPTTVIQATEAIQPDANATKITHDSLTLIEENYDGHSINRIYQYDKSKRPYIQTLDVPNSIQKEIKKSDPEAVKKVTAMLAIYYDEVDNIIKLNEILYMYISHKPESKINISKSYQQTVSENLINALNSIDDDNKNTIPEDEVEQMKETYGQPKIEKKLIPQKNKKTLYQEAKILSNELGIKWYQNKWAYIILGAVILISLFIILISRPRR